MKDENYLPLLVVGGETFLLLTPEKLINMRHILYVENFPNGNPDDQYRLELKSRSHIVLCIEGKSVLHILENTYEHDLLLEVFGLEL